MKKSDLKYVFGGIHNTRKNQSPKIHIGITNERYNIFTLCETKMTGVQVLTEEEKKEFLEKCFLEAHQYGLEKIDIHMCKRCAKDALIKYNIQFETFLF